jgi:hypothetical protein
MGCRLLATDFFIVFGVFPFGDDNTEYFMNVEILTLNILLTIRAHYVLQCTYFSRELFVEV